METIKIYHSVWRMLLLILTSFAFVAASFFMLNDPKIEGGFYVVIGWLGIVFFGLGGLLMLYAILKERLTDRPFMTITDKAIIMENMKQAIINFTDVESFEVLKGRQQKFIAIHYKPDVELQKMDEAGTIGRNIRSLNRRLVNAQETITTTGTGMKAEELCDLLNERLRRVKSS